MKGSKQKITSETKGIDAYVKNQLKTYEGRMKEIFETYDQPIAFKVSDMLRGKCMFKNITKINQCCSEIINAIQKDKEIKLIEIKNRLRMPTSDIKLKILFGNVIAELQLVINFSAAAYQFKHNI